MDQKEYQFISYKPEYKPQIIRLLSKLWGEDLKRNSAYFDWKYIENPYLDKVRMNLALHDDKIVAVRGYYALCWQAGTSGKRVLCLGDADGFVHPDHRRKGLLGLITQPALDEATGSSYEYIVTLSSNKITYGFNLSWDFQNAGFIQTAKRFRVRGGDSRGGLRNYARRVPVLPSMYRRLRSRGGSVPQEPTETLSIYQNFDTNALALSSPTDGSLSVTNLPKPEKMAELIEQISDDNRIQHVRDQAYFAWRYKNPRSTYRFIFWSSNQLDGYLVLRSPVNATGGTVTIVDWAAKNTQIYAELLMTAIELGDFLAIDIWTETLPENVKQLLRENQFHFLEYTGDEESPYFPPQLLIRAIRADVQASDWQIDGLDMLEINNWNLQAIDSDGN